MIKSFKHKGLELFFKTGSTKGINEKQRQKLQSRLFIIDTAKSIEDINEPNLRLHKLKGDMKNLWAIDVTGNWRIVFEFKDGDAYIVDYKDYH